MQKNAYAAALCRRSGDLSFVIQNRHRLHGIYFFFRPTTYSRTRLLLPRPPQFYRRHRETDLFRTSKFPLLSSPQTDANIRASGKFYRRTGRRLPVFGQ